jgi:hypothetical protein
MLMLLYSRPKIGWAGVSWCVMCDHSGALKLACSEGVDGLVAPELVEALAVRRALALTREKGEMLVLCGIAPCLQPSSGEVLTLVWVFSMLKLKDQLLFSG